MKFVLVGDSVNNSVRYVSLTAPYPVSTLAGNGVASNVDNTNGSLATLWKPYYLCFTPVIDAPPLLPLCSPFAPPFAHHLLQLTRH